MMFECSLAEIVQQMLLLSGDGRVVVGFGAGRGYAFDEFLADAAAGGLVSEVLLSAWDVRPFTAQSDFLVAVLRRSAP